MEAPKTLAFDPDQLRLPEPVELQTLLSNKLSASFSYNLQKIIGENKSPENFYVQDFILEFQPDDLPFVPTRLVIRGTLTI